MYFETHINIKKIPKYCKKICKKNCEFAKIFYCFSLFEVPYNWVKFRRLKMGDPVYTQKSDKKRLSQFTQKLDFKNILVLNYGSTKLSEVYFCVFGEKKVEIFCVFIIELQLNVSRICTQ